MEDLGQTGITLFVMTQKGLHTLQAIWAAQPGLLKQVIAARDAHVENDYFEEIRAFCDARDISFSGRSETGQVATSHAIAVSWRWLIAEDAVLVVFHDSLLPRYRGFNPLVTALINGDTEIGVTALLADKQFDHGPVIAQESIAISYPVTIQEATDLLVPGYARLAASITNQIAEGSELRAEPQDDRLATYSLWRDEDDYRIDWTADAENVRRTIDAVGHPYRGASTTCNGVLARVVRAELHPDVDIVNRSPGKVIFVEQGCPVVVCGSGLLKITVLVDDASGESLLPLRRFRTRFG